MEGYRNIMVRYGDANKRIWPTEFGWAAGWTGHARLRVHAGQHRRTSKRNGPSGPIG